MGGIVTRGIMKRGTVEVFGGVRMGCAGWVSGRGILTMGKKGIAELLHSQVGLYRGNSGLWFSSYSGLVRYT